MKTALLIVAALAITAPSVGEQAQLAASARQFEAELVGIASAPRATPQQRDQLTTLRRGCVDHAVTHNQRAGRRVLDDRRCWR